MGLFDKFKNNKVLTPEERRAKSNEIIKNMGIACCENLPLLPAGSEVKIKSVDVLCKRAYASFFAIQLGCSISNGEDYEATREKCVRLMNESGVGIGDLLPKELALFSSGYSRQNVIDVVWTYETYWVLLWALNFISDKELLKVETTCDCKKAIELAAIYTDVETAKSCAKLKSAEKLLDMADLFYRYHWACVEKQLRPQTSIGNLNPEVVAERRRGLEWLIGDKQDWNEISLDT